MMHCLGSQSIVKLLPSTRTQCLISVSLLESLASTVSRDNTERAKLRALHCKLCIESKFVCLLVTSIKLSNNSDFAQ